MSHRIVVMNLDPALLEPFTEILSEAQYDVIPHSLTDQGLAGVAYLSPDLIMLGYAGGVYTPIWLTSQLLALHRDPAAPPVILCTVAHQASEEMKPFWRAAGITLLFMPFQLDDFLMLVQTALQRSQPLAAGSQKTSRWQPEPKDLHPRTLLA
jgi:DNA-binding response OmpR family regulator